MGISKSVSDVMQLAFQIAIHEKYEYVTPEIILMAMCRTDEFADAFELCGGDVDLLEKRLRDFASDHLHEEHSSAPEFSVDSTEMLMAAQMAADNSGRGYIGMEHVLRGLWLLEESHAVYFLESQGVEEVDLLQALIEMSGGAEGIFPEEDGMFPDEEQETAVEKYAPCLNDMLENVNPLIGRSEELDRTIQILCRKDKNNVIHIGEPGVGKTAITYGLARRINDGDVPDALKGARIFSLDLGSLLAGTQYRGTWKND